MILPEDWVLIRAPQITANESSALLATWSAEEGTRVAEGQPIAVLETSKVAFELTSPADGYLYPLVDQGEVVAVGLPLAVLTPRLESARSLRERLAGPGADRGAPAQPRPPWTIKARIMAERYGIDIAEVAAGPAGRVTVESVRAHLEALGRADATGTATPLSPPSAGLSAASRALREVGRKAEQLLHRTLGGLTRVRISYGLRRRHPIIPVFVGPALFAGETIARVLRAYGAHIGGRVTFASGIFLHYARGTLRNLAIGDNCYIGHAVVLDLSDQITIGDGALVGLGAIVHTHRDVGHRRLRELYPRMTAPVHIAPDAWVAPGAVILPGVTVGARAVVAAGAVVAENVPDDQMAIGVPARLLKGRLLP